VDDCGEINT